MKIQSSLLGGKLADDADRDRFHRVSAQQYQAWSVERTFGLANVTPHVDVVGLGKFPVLGLIQLYVMWPPLAIEIESGYWWFSAEILGLIRGTAEC